MQDSAPFIASFQEWIDIFMRNTMHSFILQAKECGLSMSQIGAMFHIHRGSGGVSDIGEDLGITSAAASQMLERLVQQGLILRSEDPLDRRAKKMVLTEKGRHVLNASICCRQKWVNSLAGILSPTEQEQIIATLTLLIEKAAQLEQRSGH
jgi:DNA-binding MarR family transcriptional regulator